MKTSTMKCILFGLLLASIFLCAKANAVTSSGANSDRPTQAAVVLRENRTYHDSIPYGGSVSFVNVEVVIN
jgi:hypothetical protein